MDGYRISEVSRRTGFPASTLRFYEDAGLVSPNRTASGYRSYDERSVETLRFIARAKRLGLSLDDITELVVLFDRDRCEPVQDRLAVLVADRIAEAHQQVAELVGFTAELQRFAAHLGAHTPDGSCDERCGCTTDVVQASPVAVALVPTTGWGEAVGIVCTLDGLAGPGASAAGLARIAQWQAVLGPARARGTIDGGLRVRFDRDVDVAGLARLAAAEQSCCSFFRFAIGIDGDGVTLDITGPPEAAPVIDAFIGVAS